MSTDLCASPPSMRSISQDATPGPPDAKESLFFKPGLPGTTPPGIIRQQFIHDRMTQRHLPYPPQSMFSPAPLELRFSARFMGRGCQLEFSSEATQKYEGRLESGLLHMSSSTLYKGYKAKLAACEAACQCLLLTAWEIEEAEHFSTFLQAIHTENEGQFGLAEEELQCFRRIFSHRGQGEVDDDRDYLQAVYEDECEILRVISVQADQVAKVLGKHVKQSFLQSDGNASLKHDPGSAFFCTGNGVCTRDPLDLEDSEESDGMEACHSGSSLDDSDADSEQVKSDD